MKEQVNIQIQEKSKWQPEILQIKLERTTGLMIV